MTNRCGWAVSELMQSYHDKQWGTPTFEDDLLFKFLCLEGQQAGLKWEMILVREEAYDQAYFNHGVDYIASLSDEDLLVIIDNFGVIKYLLKQQAIRNNAIAYLKYFSGGSFSDYVWSFTNNQVVYFDDDQDVKDQYAMLLSKDLKKKGFKFIGPTICYSFFEAIGVFNNHSELCYLYKVKK